MINTYLLIEEIGFLNTSENGIELYDSPENLV